MRIVAGQYKGRPIKPPEGTNTRPTIDRVREALFSSLYSLRGGFDNACVLDAFAGSGALGLEALSRGAHEVVFYEKDRRALDTLKHNIDSLRAQSNTRIVAQDILITPPTSTETTFDLVLLDPPYKMPPEEVLSLLTDMRVSSTLAPGAIITYEHGADSVDEVVQEAQRAGFEIEAQKKYGKTRITILRESE